MDVNITCSRIEDIDAWKMDVLKVDLKDMDLREFVNDYKSALLGEFDIEDLIKAVEEEGYQVGRNNC